METNDIKPIVQRTKYTADEETTPFHEARKRRAESYNEKVPVLKEWYEWKAPHYLDHKKERKLIKKSRTKNGTTSEFVGFEKKVPLTFLEELKKKKLLT